MVTDLTELFWECELLALPRSWFPTGFDYYHCLQFPSWFLMCMEVEYVMPANMNIFWDAWLSYPSPQVFSLFRVLFCWIVAKGRKGRILWDVSMTSVEARNWILILPTFCCFWGGDLVIGVQSIKGMEIGWSINFCTFIFI